MPGITVQTNGIGIVDSGASHSNRQLLIVNGTGLSIAGSSGAWTGTLDLRDNDLVLPGASLATVTNQIAQGFSGGTWNGNGGIISSVAATDPSHLTTLGVIGNNQGGGALYTNGNTFDTTTPGAGDVLVKYTYFGDANLDGKVDSADYTNIDNGFLTGQTGWYNGDFNYDGTINGSDYTLIDNAFNMQSVQLNDSFADPSVAIATEIRSRPLTSVPEPMGAALLGISALITLGRRAVPGKRTTQKVHFHAIS